MADTRAKVVGFSEAYQGQRDDAEAGNVEVPLTVGMRKRLSVFADCGLYGRTIEEVAERFICSVLQEKEPKLS